MTPHETADTLAAISTPLGEAGIGIVRLSGPLAWVIARRLFRSRRPRSTWQSHRLYLGHIVDPQGDIIDEVMVTFMRAPYTYTREDVVEINCHSGYGVLRRILDLALAAGARLARPGEFTLRAFLSGRRTCTAAWDAGSAGCGRTSWTSWPGWRPPWIFRRKPGSWTPPRSGK
jgi:tRNA modification GTPase